MGISKEKIKVTKACIYLKEQCEKDKVDMITRTSYMSIIYLSNITLNCGNMVHNVNNTRRVGGCYTKCTFQCKTQNLV